MFSVGEWFEYRLLNCEGINKPAANVYKALGTLSQKGAVNASMSNSKSFSAIHWKELLERHRKQFQQTWKHE